MKPFGRPFTQRIRFNSEPVWLTAWVALLMVLFLLPTLLLARAQQKSLHLDRQAWEAMLNPALPDPGYESPDDLPTDRARRVTIGFYLESMDEISLHDSHWRGVLDIWCRWKDDPDAPGGPDFDPFEHLIVVNGTIADRRTLREIHSDGEHYVLNRCSLECTKAFQVVNFPLDRHLILASFENSDHTRQELLFAADQESSAVSRRVAMSAYRIVGFQALENPHSYQTSRGLPGASPAEHEIFSQPRFAIIIERDGWGLFFKMFQALFVAVAVALLACFIKPTHVDPRFGLGVGALFAAVANTYLVGSYVPETSAFSLADVVNMLGIGTILVSLTQSTISLWLYDSLDKRTFSRRLDWVSFWAILWLFVASIALILAAAVNRS
ncbi:MAG: hypothetical protein WCH79_02555 [Planctomycetia bacterium]